MRGFWLYWAALLVALLFCGATLFWLFGSMWAPRGYPFHLIGAAMVVVPLASLVVLGMALFNSVWRRDRPRERVRRDLTYWGLGAVGGYVALALVLTPPALTPITYRGDGYLIPADHFPVAWNRSEDDAGMSVTLCTADWSGPGRTGCPSAAGRQSSMVMRLTHSKNGYGWLVRDMLGPTIALEGDKIMVDAAEPRLRVLKTGERSLALTHGGWLRLAEDGTVTAYFAPLSGNEHSVLMPVGDNDLYFHVLGYSSELQSADAKAVSERALALLDSWTCAEPACGGARKAFDLYRWLLREGTG